MMDSRLEITFASKHLEQLCMDDKFQRKHLSGAELKGVQRRYNQLFLVENVAELFEQPGKWHTLQGDRKLQVAGRTTGNKRFVIVGTDTAGLAGRWSECRAVKILDVNFDYHQGR